MDFNGKKVIVTGATRSIGQSIALAFAKQGAQIALSFRDDGKKIENTINQIKDLGAESKAFFLDLTDFKTIPAFLNQAIDYLGHIDILINNAGILCRETFFELSPQKIQTIFQINCISPFYLTQLCCENMIKNEIKGCVINISSINGKNTMPNRLGYGPSKAALNKWTKHAALELAEYGIRVNAIAPGVIQAGMNENTSETHPEIWGQLISKIPLKRAGTPNDIANMALFLASSKANWITGKIYEVDGGNVL